MGTAREEARTAQPHLRGEFVGSQRCFGGATPKSHPSLKGLCSLAVLVTLLTRNFGASQPPWQSLEGLNSHLPTAMKHRGEI